MIINPGKLKRKVILQKHAATTDAIGNPQMNWENHMTLWADINSLYGTEYWTAANYGQQDTIVFTVRFNKKLDRLAKSNLLTECRILFRDIAYDIIHYDNIGFENKLVKIKAVQR